MQHWLLKTEPETYSITMLAKDKKTNWNGVRNFQARNYIKKMAKGDIALIYHSGDDKAVVGIAKVVKEAYVDLDPDGGEWAQVDIAFVEKLKGPVPLSTIKASKPLADMPLIRQSRLSVMPITEHHYNTVVALASKS